MIVPATGQVRSVWPVGAALGEGTAWSARGQCLWFVDITGRRLYRLHPASGGRRCWDAPDRIGFVVERDDGGWVAGLATRLALFSPHDGTFALLAPVEPERSSNRLNDGAVGPDGALWFGSMDDRQQAASGALYRWAGYGRAERVDDGIVITNGPAFAPDGRAIYYCDTVNRRIIARPLGSGGALGPVRTVATVGPEEGYPDGIAVDAAGDLWVAMYGGWAIRCFGPDGQRKAVIDLPCANPTKPAFGDADRRTLYIATARQGLDGAALQRQPLAGDLLAVRVAVAGAATGVLPWPGPALGDGGPRR